MLRETLISLACCCLMAGVAWSQQSPGKAGGKPAAAPVASPASAAQPLVHDLSNPEYNAADCPAWAKETVPDSIKPYLGKNGLPDWWRNKKGPLATGVKGIDRYQANNFVNYRPETAEFLYTSYTPTTIAYQSGTLPTYEKIAGEVTADCKTDTERAVTLLLKAVPQVKHPTMAPVGPPVVASRNADDESLLNSGLGWCNEQARVFVRFCQVCGIPARIVHLFYSDKKTGHTIAEFYADGAWHMADASWFCVFPGPDGKLMSAAQCHDKGEGQKYCGIAYEKRFREIAKLPDALLVGEQDKRKDPQAAAKARKEFETTTAQQLADKMGDFAFINYPLPK